LFASKDPKEVSNVITKRHCNWAPAENHGKGNNGKGNNGKDNNSKEPWQQQQWQEQQRQWAKATAKWARNTATAATTKNHGNGNNGKEPWQQRHKPRKGSNESNGQQRPQWATTTAMGKRLAMVKHVMGKQFIGQRACKFSVIQPSSQEHDDKAWFNGQRTAMGKGKGQQWQWVNANDDNGNGQRQMTTTAMGKGKGWRRQWAKAKDDNGNEQRQMTTTAMGKGKGRRRQWEKAKDDNGNGQRQRTAIAKDGNGKMEKLQFLFKRLRERDRESIRRRRMQQRQQGRQGATTIARSNNDGKEQQQRRLIPFYLFLYQKSLWRPFKHSNYKQYNAMQTIEEARRSKGEEEAEAKEKKTAF
jgi:hypothetical protein